MKNYVVRMIREHMEDIPNYPFPEGFSMRTYRPGEGHIWMRIQRAAEPFLQIDDGLFEREFGRHLQALEDRCFFLMTDTGEEIGTITAWWQPYWRSKEWGQLHAGADHSDAQEPGSTRSNRSKMIAAMQRLKQTKPCGHLHWAAIHPDYQGRGLYKPVVAVALQRIKLSHDRCSYITSTQRPAAIKVFLDCGFSPDLDEEKSHEVWAGVASILPHSMLKQCGL